MAFERGQQAAGRPVWRLLWASSLAAAAAGLSGADNESLNHDPFHPRPRIVYKPHGIQLDMPRAPPAPRRMLRPRRPLGPPLPPLGQDPSQLSEMGSRGYMERQYGFAPPPGMRLDPRLANIPGFPLRGGHNLAAGPSSAYGQEIPGLRGSGDARPQQAFGSDPLAPRPAGPSYPPGYYPRREVTFPPMNPWFGLPIPTPLGPGSQVARPGWLQPLPAPSRSPLAPPLRRPDLQRGSESAEQERVPEDTWRGAMLGKVPRPPRPGELRGHARGEGGEREDTAEEEYVSRASSPPSPQLVTRGLPSHGAPRRGAAPPLLHDDMLNDAAPLDDAPSSEAEFLANLAAERLNDEHKHEDTSSSDTSSERSNAFDHLLLV